MRRRPPRTDLVLTLTALCAVTLLLGLAGWLAPARVALADAREGARVEIEARVLELRDGARARWLMLSDGATRMPAFAPLAPALTRGDIVRVVGIVARDEDGLLLSLERVHVVEPTARVVRDPGELAARPREFDGARVIVAGDVRDGAIAGGGARVRLGGEAAPREGAVEVVGTFRYRETDASYIVWVESWTPRS